MELTPQDIDHCLRHLHAVAVQVEDREDLLAHLTCVVLHISPAHRDLYLALELGLEILVIEEGFGDAH